MEKVEYKFEKLQQASARLDEALALDFPTPETKADSVIQRFEFTTELFWKFLKELLEFNRVDVRPTPLEVFRVAKSSGFLSADDRWVALLGDRSLTCHTYNDKQAAEIFTKIKDEYAAMFRGFIEDYSRTR